VSFKMGFSERKMFLFTNPSWLIITVCILISVISFLVSNIIDY